MEIAFLLLFINTIFLGGVILLKMNKLIGLLVTIYCFVWGITIYLLAIFSPTSLPFITVKGIAVIYGHFVCVLAAAVFTFNSYHQLLSVKGISIPSKYLYVGCLVVSGFGISMMLYTADVWSFYVQNQLAELRNKKIGFIFKSFNILARTSAIENVELPLLYNSSVSSKERRARAFKALESVGLANRAGSMPNQLSGGQQQRVAIARALVNEPVVIMADEPTGNLDTRTSYEIMGIFQELNEKGITVVMVTHEPDIAEFAKSNIIFRDGKIISNQLVSERKKASVAILELLKEAGEPS